eukprot:TRINITY_DN353_c0_g1_i1.p1 TRINITY_DN353_c0_g1~~TRINITY_DN353_c0_g1_i1.p1  ORF type:complete len:152 (-),score=28.70 TRINITY_DN353_c0_g1_i1:134-544(-)
MKRLLSLRPAFLCARMPLLRVPTRQFAVKHLKSLEELEKTVSGQPGKLVVLDWFATWCGPCKQISPIFEKLSNDPVNKNVVFVKADVDEMPEGAEKYGVSAMPTFQMMKEGKVVETIVGASPAKLRDLVAKHRPSA